MNYTAKNIQDEKTLYYQTPAGMLGVTSTPMGITQADFVEGLKPSDVLSDISVQVVFNGTPFQRKVWKAIINIKRGSTMTYQEVAVLIGQPKAYRAVANALGANRIVYFIPCHRVVRKNGSLGGFKWGIERKRLLLEAEKIKS